MTNTERHVFHPDQLILKKESCIIRQSIALKYPLINFLLIYRVLSTLTIKSSGLTMIFSINSYKANLKQGVDYYI